LPASFIGSSAIVLTLLILTIEAEQTTDHCKSVLPPISCYPFTIFISQFIFLQKTISPISG